ncbi:MAG TPA: hypothetical protein VI685_10700 [Candidatus Angelobacter sp.]
MKKQMRPKRHHSAKRSGLFSFRVESGCVVLRARGDGVHIRVFESAAAAISAGLTKRDHIVYGRDSGSTLGEYIPPPEGKCENIDCHLDFTGSTADDMEFFVSGKCKEPCTCTLYVQKAPDKPWESKGPKGRVKLKDYSGYAAVCDK